MSRSQTYQSEDMHDQLTILVGSAIQLLGSDAGVLVIATEAFDPQSNNDYVVYRLGQEGLAKLLQRGQEGLQPTSRHPLVIEIIEPEWASQILPQVDNAPTRELECCSLAIFDTAGPVGTLYFLRTVGERSCFERREGAADGHQAMSGNVSTEDVSVEASAALNMFIAHQAAALRCALKAQSLVKEQGRLASIFHHSIEGLLTVDSALRIIDFNPAMEKLIGWRESDVLGEFYFNVLRPRDRRGNELGLQDSPLLQAFSGQSVVNRDMIFTTRDGQPVEVRVTASCIRSARGEPLNGILTIHDITREREQEEQRSTFISVISHELQTPIAIIKGYASTLARAGDRLQPQALRPRLVAIEEEADRLNKLVANLLYASRIQANGLQMEASSLDLEPLIETVVRRLQARDAELRVSVEISPDLPAVVGDRERIEEVLQNLLDNAIKYSPQQVAVTIAARATSNEVIVSVSDAGMGISLRDQEQIFRRFRRIGDPLAQATPGAGLGLYICRAIVEAHGGRIWVESTLRQGSTFSFSLPREKQAHLPMVVF
ncbi:sensor histidine kinase [Ktedonospora formicarum]|uniref:histidine kinase n=1 Tax=Ktedonospora formicarum TaxID=2778364 RepID=A0A8J3I266_9CHLR|nr:ATP-binding protein [Ktedonospora formicarum]GHO44104.1 histidine kinase [Ktedonospora formicarum]